MDWSQKAVQDGGFPLPICLDACVVAPTGCSQPLFARPLCSAHCFLQLRSVPSQSCLPHVLLAQLPVHRLACVLKTRREACVPPPIFSGHVTGPWQPHLGSEPPPPPPRFSQEGSGSSQSDSSDLLFRAPGAQQCPGGVSHICILQARCCP